MFALGIPMVTNVSLKHLSQTNFTKICFYIVGVLKEKVQV